MENPQISEREYYINVIKEHKRILGKARNLVEHLINKISDEVEQYEHVEENARKNPDSKKAEEEIKNIRNKFWWGEKENAISASAKLIQLLLKIIPAEAKIAQTDLENCSNQDLMEVKDYSEISDEDLKILEHYIESRKREREQ